ncbi:hypothetical protein QBC45DRAFT_463132, partial [Copromyces sp. CBS 386.78]
NTSRASTGLGFKPKLLLSINQPKPASRSTRRHSPETNCPQLLPRLPPCLSSGNNPATAQLNILTIGNMPRGRGSGYDFPKPIGACPPPKPSSGVGTGASKGSSDDGSDKEKGTGSSGSHGGSGSK